MLAVAPEGELVPLASRLLHRIDSRDPGPGDESYRILLVEDDEDLARLLSAVLASPTQAQATWLADLRTQIALGSERAQARIAVIQRLALQAGELAQQEYAFLYDKDSHLLSIGYNVDERRRDASYYDLLASEARLSVFVAIAQGQLPQESWFALGRLLTSAGGKPILLSWSGSMFEYLMPQLVMPTYDHTLLDQTARAAVARQIQYGQQRDVPWGMSESAYNTVDVHLNYQYRAFGVPGLGLKRGLVDDLVVAPYASALALMVAPEAACLNLQQLSAAGAEGRFGFYEAIDYGGLEIQDVKASRDYMVENYDIVDSDRIGILGWSHGGLITLMNIFEYPDSYKVAYAGVPVSEYARRLGRDTVHNSPELLKKSVYGLTELHRDAIDRDRMVVGNPGCFATAMLLGVVPLTTDQGFFLSALEAVHTDSAPRGGSLIGDAIRKVLDEGFDDQEKKYKDLVLITDGEDHDSFPVEAAEEAADKAVAEAKEAAGEMKEAAEEAAALFPCITLFTDVPWPPSPQAEGRARGSRTMF